MIEFTILLDDLELEFTPASSSPDLSLVLPPTARIVSGDAVVIRKAPLGGTATGQPREAGAGPCRIIAYNPDEKRVLEIREVDVIK